MYGFRTLEQPTTLLAFLNLLQWGSKALLVRGESKSQPIAATQLSRFTASFPHILGSCKHPHQTAHVLSDLLTQPERLNPCKTEPNLGIARHLMKPPLPSLKRRLSSGIDRSFLHWVLWEHYKTGGAGCPNKGA